jgi:hypothetical protein
VCLAGGGVQAGGQKDELCPLRWSSDRFVEHREADGGNEPETGNCLALATSSRASHVGPTEEDDNIKLISREAAVARVGLEKIPLLQHSGGVDSAQAFVLVPVGDRHFHCHAALAELNRKRGWFVRVVVERVGELAQVSVRLVGRVLTKTEWAVREYCRTRWRPAGSA